MDNGSYDHLEIYDLEFPENCIGECIGDVNLEILALDTLRIIEVFGRNGGLTDKQTEVLEESCREFDMVLGLFKDEYERVYFKKLSEEALRVLAQIKNP